MRRPPHTFTFALLLALAALSVSGGRTLANPYNVSEVPKLISVREAPRLHQAGVHSTDDLLRRAATADDRKRLARAARLSGARVTQLARCADLLRLENIGPEFVILLEAVGVKSIPDLATRNPTALTRQAAALNRTRRIAHPAPTEPQIRDWISQSGKLPALLISG